MKFFKTPESEENAQEVIVSFRKNLVTGSALLKVSVDEWKEIIPPVGLRRHIRAQLQKIIRKKRRLLSLNYIKKDF
jgi:hypothetical protein